MFKSRIRPIIIPQSEHLKLVGTLAYLWGNDDFDFPPISRSSLVAGVGLHDRGYGVLDNSPVGEMPKPEWVEITRRGFYMPWSDAAGDMIVKHHLLRLSSFDKQDIVMDLHVEFKQVITDLIEKREFSAELFARIDRITEVCDRISVDFCREEPLENEIMVYPKNDSSEQIPLHYRVSNGEIEVKPWPFSVDKYNGYILGYRQLGYPEVPDPVILPFTLSTNRKSLT